MIAGLLEILRFPVQLTYARHTVIDHHGLFVSDIEGRLGVEDLEAGGPEDAARSVVLDFTTVASRVEHHSNLDGATPNPPVYPAASVPTAPSCASCNPAYTPPSDSRYS